MTQNWCWAAASQMVLASRGVPVDQCAILSKWYGVNCCGNFSACDVPGSNEQIRNTMLFEGNLSSSVINRPLSWQEAVAEIDQGRPFIIGYRSSFIGHVVVAFGYNEATRTLSLHDPMYGTFEVPYGSTFSYAQQAFWGFTIGNFGSRPSPTNKCCTQAGTFISQAPGEAGTACAAPNPLTSGPIPGLWCY